MDQQMQLENPFKMSEQGVNKGTVQIEQSRAVTEAMGKLVMARQTPRDKSKAYNDIIEACSRPGVAEAAEYAYARGNQTVTGPTIRLAEELARCWGNIEYGIRELSRTEDSSEMEAYAWDLETNTLSSQKFTVRHFRDTRQGLKRLTSERDIYEITANMGGRRLRARLLAVLPPDIVESAITQCRRTIAGNVDAPIADRIRRVVNSFSKYGVSGDHLQKYIGKSLDDLLPDDIADLQSVFNSIKAGASASEFFGNQTAETEVKTLEQTLGDKKQETEQVAKEPAEEEPAPETTTTKDEEPQAEKASASGIFGGKS